MKKKLSQSIYYKKIKVIGKPQKPKSYAREEVYGKNNK